MDNSFRNADGSINRWARSPRNEIAKTTITSRGDYINFHRVLEDAHYCNRERRGSNKKAATPWGCGDCFGTLERSRTPNLQIRSLSLYPIELWARSAAAGREPAALIFTRILSGLFMRHSLCCLSCPSRRQGLRRSGADRTRTKWTNLQITRRHSLAHRKFVFMIARRAGA